MKKSPVAAFVHGRPGPHPFHQLLADSVNADSYFVDYLIRWHDLDTSRAYRYMSIVLSSLWFPRKGQYDVVISEGLHALPALVKIFSLRRRPPKATAIMDNETLHFIKSGFYQVWMEAAS